VPADHSAAKVSPILTRPRLQLGRWLRLSLGLGLLALLARIVNWAEITPLFAGLGWAFVALALALKGVSLLLSGLRWQIVLRAGGSAVPLRRLVRHYWVMLFFNNFVPTMVGADAIRVLMLNETRSPALRVVSVLVERLFGLVALLSFAALALWTRPELLQYTTLSFAALTALAGTVGLLGAILLPELWWWALRWIERFPRLGHLIHEVYQAGRQYRRAGRTLLLTVVISVLIQVLVIVSFGLRVRALGLEIGLIELGLVVPVTVLLTLIPITPGGWGTQEGLYLLILGTIGISPENALAIALLSRVLDVVFSAFGGLLWALERHP